MPITIGRLKRICHDALAYPAVRCFLFACVLSFLIEILNQRSVLGAFGQILTHPTVTTYNMLLILMAVSLSGLFRRQVFSMVIFALPWVVLSVANFVLQSFRSTPLSAVDFKVLPSVIHIIDYYLTVWQIILIVLAILSTIALLVLLCLKSHKQARHWRSSVALIVLCAVLLSAGTPLLLHMDVLSDSYSNLNKAYRDYGFPYCFLVSLVDRGIDEPEEYSEKTVDSVLNNLDTENPEHDPSAQQSEPEPDASVPVIAPTSEVPESPEPVTVQPNIIFLQLESFIDANDLIELTFSENPTPFFSELKGTCPSGMLTVPTYGAGTVNTEFEVLTGMNLEYFGAGEYPYISVLHGQTCETIAYNLKENGYTATAIHNNTATFYDRNLVFANLGFDRFISEEYMNGLEYTSVGWPKDKHLTYDILKTLDLSEGPDLVYTISVQPHGKYPTDLQAELSRPIQITSGFDEEASELQAAYTYYINQLREVDDFLRELTEALSSHEEPTMLIAFGDHFPNFELEEHQVRSGSLFQTEYIVWTNYTMEAENRDLTAYQLSAYALELIGCDTGILTRLHQTHSGSEDYQAYLELLEYDMLFGEKNVWDGGSPYIPTALQLGYGDIRFESASFLGSQLYLSGFGFNKWSVVFFDEEPQETVYINSNTLLAADEAPEVGIVITVRQVAEDGLVLSSTEAIAVTEQILTEPALPESPATDDPDPGSSPTSSGQPTSESADPTESVPSES